VTTERPVRDAWFVSRLERFGAVDSTQRIVREWLDAGTPEVAVAVADVQSAGRGRHGRSWSAPSGAALLVSCGFRPAELRLSHAWRLGATVALAMLDAAQEVAALKDGTLWLKWPNDVVAIVSDGRPRKVAGVLGETVAKNDCVATGVVGLGMNVDWAADAFPPDLAPTMTSLRELAARPVDRDALLDAFLDRLEPRYEALHDGRFDARSWSARQCQTGQPIEVLVGDRLVHGLASGVHPESGALLVESDGAEVAIDSGEVRRCRVTGRGGARTNR
jgi:BirA family biotin operon repressor/biotin-[acetyl-CoA-carboxylase] ligase